jgi:hypothetical protein
MPHEQQAVAGVAAAEAAKWVHEAEGVAANVQERYFGSNWWGVDYSWSTLCRSRIARGTNAKHDGSTIYPVDDRMGRNWTIAMEGINDEHNGSHRRHSRAGLDAC